MCSNLPPNLQHRAFTSLGHTIWGSTSLNIHALPSLAAEHVASTLGSHFPPRAVPQERLQVPNGHTGTPHEALPPPGWWSVYRGGQALPSSYRS